MSRLKGIFSRMRTHPTGSPPVDFTDIAFVASGTAASGTTSCAVPYPTLAAGDGLILIMGTKLQYPIVSTPTGWRRIKDSMGYEGSNGGDQGGIRQTVFWKEADGTESGSLNVTVDGGNSSHGIMYSFRKDPNAEWNISVFRGYHGIPNTTSFSAQSLEHPDSEVDDLYLVTATVNTDTHGWSNQALTQTGVTFSTVTQEINEVSTTTGNDQEHFSSLFRVTASTPRGAMIYSATSTGASSSPANPIGVVSFIRLRQSALAQTWEPSGLQIWRAAQAVDTTYTGDASMIWDGMRTSTELTGTVSDERYSIATHNGRPCYRFRNQLINSTNYCRRAEVSQPLPWQPAYPVGTHLIHEIRYETPANAPSVYREFDIVQNHTGTAAGGPYPLNSPIFYLAFAHAGQTGWTNSSGGAVTASGGELGIVLTTTAPDIRRLIPTVVWAPNTVYRIRYHVKFDYSTGDPCLKLWVDDNLVYEDYTSPTVFSDSDIPTHGAPANVGGIPKIGIYDHFITSGTAAANAVAAGNTGYTLFSPVQKMVIQHPTDIDYISDVTDNANPIYNYVDTSDATVSVSFVSAGAQSNAATSLSMAQPAGLAAGDLLICSISNKYSGVTPPTPTGYTLLVSATGGAGSDASVEDEGSVRTSLYYRIADGSETSNLAVTVTGANISSGGILCFRNNTGQWAITGGTASRNTGGTPWSVTSNESLAVSAGMMFVAINGENSSLHAGGSTATVQISSSNILASTTKFFDVGTGGGSNIRSCGHYGLVNTTATGNISYSTVMGGTTTATHPAGATVFAILEERPALV